MMCAANIACGSRIAPFLGWATPRRQRLGGRTWTIDRVASLGPKCLREFPVAAQVRVLARVRERRSRAEALTRARSVGSARAHGSCVATTECGPGSRASRGNPGVASTRSLRYMAGRPTLRPRRCVLPLGAQCQPHHHCDRMAHSGVADNNVSVRDSGPSGELRPDTTFTATLGRDWGVQADQFIRCANGKWVTYAVQLGSVLLKDASYLTTPSGSATFHRVEAGTANTI